VRKRWMVVSLGFNPEATFIPGHDSDPMMWTGRYFYPMWTHESRDAKTFTTKDEADSAALFFTAKHPEWFGKIAVKGYMDVAEDKFAEES
jgi:hypothetical protein